MAPDFPGQNLCLKVDQQWVWIGKKGIPKVGLVDSGIDFARRWVTERGALGDKRELVWSSQALASQLSRLPPQNSIIIQSVLSSQAPRVAWAVAVVTWPQVLVMVFGRLVYPHPGSII